MIPAPVRRVNSAARVPALQAGSPRFKSLTRYQFMPPSWRERIATGNAVLIRTTPQASKRLGAMELVTRSTDRLNSPGAKGKWPETATAAPASPPSSSGKDARPISEISVVRVYQEAPRSTGRISVRKCEAMVTALGGRVSRLNQELDDPRE